MGALHPLRPFRAARLFLARHPFAYWSLVGLTAGAVALHVGRAEQRADQTRASWGRSVEVLVLRHDIPTGGAVGTGDVDVVRWPARLAPGADLTSVPSGAVATAPLLAGERLVAARLGSAGVGPVAGLVGAGRRGIAVPMGDASLPVVVGDPVDVLGADAVGETTAVLARHAQVIHVGEAQVVVAVREGAATAVATAVLTGSAVLAFSPGGPPTPAG